MRERLMSGMGGVEITRRERIERFVMSSCALILFALGVLLLIGF
jgi:hypothetical protein